MILLDTHAVIWLLLAPEKLSIREREAILQARGEREQIGFSSVSIYEIANAVRRKRLILHSTTEEFVAAIQSKLTLVPFTVGIAICAAELPDPFHGDPMDRIIAATAIVGDWMLITHDDRIRGAGACKVLC